MEAIFPTFFSKTFFVLSLQLLITWISAHITLIKFRQLHDKDVHWITSTENEHGQIDLHIDWEHIKGYFYVLLITDIIVFLVLLFWGEYQSLGIALSIFAIWSVLVAHLN